MACEQVTRFRKFSMQTMGQVVETMLKHHSDALALEEGEEVEPHHMDALLKHSAAR